MKTTQSKNKTRMLALGLVVLALIFSGCEKPPVSTERTDNAAITVDLLFEKDGVKVYRFEDFGNKIYYTDARGATQWRELNGGGNSETKTVPTVR